MADLEVLGVDNIMLAVGDLEQARSFYESTLGLPVKFAVPQAGVVGYRLGGEEPGLMIRVQALPPSPPRDTPRVWLEVRDARAAAAALRAKGSASWASQWRSSRAGPSSWPTRGETFSG